MEQNINELNLNKLKQAKTTQVYLKELLLDKEYQEEANRHLTALYKLCNKKRKRPEININKIDSDSSSSDAEIICKFEKKPRREEPKLELKEEAKLEPKKEVKKEDKPICNICFTDEGSYLLKPVCCSYEMHMDCALNYIVTNRKTTCPQCRQPNFFGDRYGNLVSKNIEVVEEEEEEDSIVANYEAEAEDNGHPVPNGQPNASPSYNQDEDEDEDEGDRPLDFSWGQTDENREVLKLIEHIYQHNVRFIHSFDREAKIEAIVNAVRYFRQPNFNFESIFSTVGYMSFANTYDELSGIPSEFLFMGNMIEENSYLLPNPLSYMVVDPTLTELSLAKTCTWCKKPTPDDYIITCTKGLHYMHRYCVEFILTKRRLKKYHWILTCVKGCLGFVNSI